MARVVVVGDVGGHPDQLEWALSGVGARGVPPVLPDDVIVIEVGDLVDRGPDSMAVLRLVQGIIDRQPQQWIQLLGNHEGQYLPGRSQFWPDRLPEEGVRMLASWWSRGLLNVAAAVRTEEGEDLLLTHAGLTVGCWQELGAPMSAAAAARLLNDRPELIWRGGEIAVDRASGPLWAEGGWELQEPWLEHYSAGGFVPFSQIHGHSTIVQYGDRTWRCPGRVRQRATVDWAARHVTVRVGGRVVIGVDPRHGRDGAPNWMPLILERATVLGGVAAPRVA